MRLFGRFFGKGYEDKIEDNDSNIINWADSITIGWEYRCNLFLTTPKICLENDGLIISDISKPPKLFGEPNKIGIDGEPSGNYGSWIRRHGYEEEFEELANIKENINYARKSDIGRIASKSNLENNFKRFLIDFRQIIESEDSVQNKIFKINKILCLKSKINKAISIKLRIDKGFPEEFFKNELCNLLGIDKEISDIFWNAGYFSKEDIVNTPDSKLLEINGIRENVLINIKRNIL